jgi:hypothetical protein
MKGVTMNAVDMSAFIAPKSDQINADDLIGGPITIRITRVSANEGSPEQPININFEGDEGKPFRPCKSMRRVMVHIWGADASKYVGRAMTLYRDPKVQFGGMQVGGIRISHMSDIPADKLGDGKVQMALTATRAKRAPFTVLPLKDAPPAKGDDLGAWAHKFIASVANVPSADKLDAGVAQVQGKIDALADAIPEAHAAVVAAIEAKRASFAPADDDDPFAEPSSGEPTDHSAFIAGIERRIAGAEQLEQFDEIAEDLGKMADSLPDEQVSRLDAAIAARRRALGKGR